MKKSQTKVTMKTATILLSFGLLGALVSFAWTLPLELPPTSDAVDAAATEGKDPSLSEPQLEDPSPAPATPVESDDEDPESEFDGPHDEPASDEEEDGDSNFPNDEPESDEEYYENDDPESDEYQEYSDSYESDSYSDEAYDNYSYEKDRERRDMTGNDIESEQSGLQEPEVVDREPGSEDEFDGFSATDDLDEAQNDEGLNDGDNEDLGDDDAYYHNLEPIDPQDDPAEYADDSLFNEGEEDDEDRDPEEAEGNYDPTEEEYEG